MTFRQRPEISEGESHTARWSRNVPEGSNTREETLRQEHAWSPREAGVSCGWRGGKG